MRRPFLAALCAAAALCLSLVALAPSAGASPSHRNISHRDTGVCSSARPGQAACQAIRHDTVDENGTVLDPNTLTPDAEAAPNATSVPAGALTPADIQAAYKLPGTARAGAVVAIVDAYDLPTAESDLGVYRTQFGLPACTSDNGCFKKIGQNGPAGSLPAANAGWGQEIALDIDMVSAACPTCGILLVEANSSSFNDLAIAVNTAAAQPGVVAISNSYGGSDLSATTYASIAQAYNRTGIAVTASTGDSGYGVQSPASFPGVVAVGGTSLRKATTTNGRGWTETAWSGAGSGCSRYNAKPAYQNSNLTRCTRKADADVSAVADPNTGVAVYDSTAYQGASGWMQFGGTSASSPIIASVYAQGPQIPAGTYAGAYTWGHASGTLFDVTTGSNGRCTTRVWCTAGTNWDGPTGLGTPNGTGAF
jgi:subtilase family serine protease